MRKMRNFKKVTAVVLAASMVMGGAMTALAAESGDTSVNSSGDYEGGEMKYPALSITLPVIADGAYDYIADPNGLIKATETESGDAAKYADSQFQGDTGIYFLTTAKDASNPKNIYTEKSAAKKVTNENAQNIDVTVKLEKGTKAGDADIALASSNEFTGTDKELYLAVTDGADKTSALSSAAAEVTTMVPGNKDNYEPKYNASNGYGYQKKNVADLAAWSECSFYLTGALNMDAKWEDNVAFPDIKVTWSYKENTAPADAAPSVTVPGTYTQGNDVALDIPYSLGAGSLGAGAISDVIVTYNGALFSKNGYPGSDTSMSEQITIGNNKITLSGLWLSYFPTGTYPICVVFDTEGVDPIIVNLEVQ